jgi:hypothetical protein
MFTTLIEKSYSNLHVTSGTDDCNAKSFEELWEMRKDVKNKKFPYPAKTFWNKLLLVFANTQDVERFILVNCLKQNNKVERITFIENVKSTLDGIKMKKLVRDKIELTDEDVKNIIYQIFKTRNDETEIINVVGVDKWFEFKSDEYRYKLRVIEDIPGVMNKVYLDISIST